MPLHQIISVLSDPSQGNKNKSCLFYIESITKQPSLMNNERNNRVILFVNILKSYIEMCAGSHLEFMRWREDARAPCRAEHRAKWESFLLAG